MKYQSELISDIISNKNCESSDEFVKSKKFKCLDNIFRERYDIENEKQASYYNKEIGRYELLSIPNPLDLTEDEENTIILELVKILKGLLKKINSRSSILVVGLGNRHISADSLGTAITKKVNVSFGCKKFPKVMAICPSVLGLTGIETYDIVKGVVDRVNPTHVILIDSLCAGDDSRLGKSIQISNTGVCPGSVIGNHRKCLDISLAKNVVSIGVPLLIYASTFIASNYSKNNITLDRISGIMQSIKNTAKSDGFYNILKDIKNSYKVQNDMVVCIKDIEECVDVLSKIISKALNISLNVDELS